MKYCPEALNELSPLLRKYDILSKNRKDYTFNLFYENQEEIENVLVENTLEVIDWCFRNREKYIDLESLLINYNNQVREFNI